MSPGIGVSIHVCMQFNGLSIPVSKVVLNTKITMVKQRVFSSHLVIIDTVQVPFVMKLLFVVLRIM